MYKKHVPELNINKNRSIKLKKKKIFLVPHVYQTTNFTKDSLRHLVTFITMSVKTWRFECLSPKLEYGSVLSFNNLLTILESFLKTDLKNVYFFLINAHARTKPISRFNQRFNQLVYRNLPVLLLQYNFQVKTFRTLLFLPKKPWSTGCFIKTISWCNSL